VCVTHVVASCCGSATVILVVFWDNHANTISRTTADTGNPMRSARKVISRAVLAEKRVPIKTDDTLSPSLAPALSVTILPRHESVRLRIGLFSVRVDQPRKMLGLPVRGNRPCRPARRTQHRPAFFPVLPAVLVLQGGACVL
jgi:hypothetical protein